MQRGYLVAIGLGHALVILAAGKGTRMNSALPKVMHEIAGLPMLGHVIHNGLQAGFEKIVLVTAPDQQSVRQKADDIHPNIRHAIQEKALGTGDAVAAALDQLHDADRTVIVFGDTPLMRQKVLTALAETESDLLVLGFVPDVAGRYGRIVTKEGKPVRIVEAKDATEDELKIRLCNAGAMSFKTEVLANLLTLLTPNNAQGEYYLTDLVALGHQAGAHLALAEVQAEDVMGVDTRAALAHAEAVIQNRYREQFLASGVTMEDPQSVYFYHDTQIARDVHLEPHIRFGANVRVEENVRINAFSHIEGATISHGAQIGPFARLRPGTIVGAGGKIGNFVETKNAKLEAGVKVNHLSYIGDAEIGAQANIGAGTITCNYDGFNKHVTRIGAGAFIGSNSSLIAPVTIGEGAYVGSGTAISGTVDNDDLAVTRAPVKTVKGWAAKFRKKNSKG
jgi:bifunctional UDP-N-acetylglucosamine pyrophosphorylase/glucosamine-1-phosphate N-acetyltransferase